MQAEGPKIDLSDDWLTGEGIALTMIDTVPPDAISPMPGFRAEDGGFELVVAPPSSATAPRRCIARSRRLRSQPPSTKSACCNPTRRMAATTPAPMAVPGRLSPDGHAGRGGKLADDLQGFCFHCDQNKSRCLRPENDSAVCAGELSYVQLAEAARAQGQLSVRPAPRRARRGRWPSMCRAFASR